MLKPTSATTVARYRTDYYAGKPAITLNQFGQGQVLYLGTMGDTHLYELLTRWLVSVAEDLQRILNVPNGIEVTERWQDDQRLLFVLNHTRQEQEIALDSRYIDLLDGASTLEGTIVVAPLDVRVLQEK